MLRLAVLGPLGVYSNDEPLAVPAGRASELLVRLALDAGRPVAADLLLEDLWGSQAVHTRRNTLQSKVAMLRRGIGDVATVTGDSYGYTLHVTAEQVDALVVQDCLTQAAELLEEGDAPGAAEVAATALALFPSGSLLPAAGEGAWTGPHRTRLGQTRAELLQVWLAARLRSGSPGATVIELQAAVEAFPFHEGLWELLITALYRSGRQSDALAACRDIRARLTEELGLDPGPQLRQLELRLLNHDAALVHHSSNPRSTNLPAIGRELVGRADDLVGLGRLARGNRLVTVLGTGGVGKTAVAIETGRMAVAELDRFPDGVWLARLESATTAEDVVDVLRAAVDGTASAEALFERLQGMRALLILDNCEHVVDAAAQLAQRLIDQAPGIRVLCTSQTPLQVLGEQLYQLAPLTVDDSVTLFAQRQFTRPGQQPPAAEARAVVELVRSLDGLPLAIELAAARTRSLSVDEIGRRLDDRFHVLSDPASRQPERRRSLEATIRWSYDLLFPDDQRGLWAMATFAGGAPLPALIFVLQALDVPDSAAIDVVDRLVSRSLLIVDVGTSSEHSATAGSTRYRLLDSIRAFSFATMTDQGHASIVLAAHAAWYAQAAAASTAGVRSSYQQDFLAIARTDRANIDAALSWASVHDPLVALQIVNGFGWAWVVLGDSRGAQRIVSVLAAVGDAAANRDRATALLLAAWIEASTGRLEPAQAHLEHASALADSHGDEDLQARRLYYLAYVASHDGDFAQALEFSARSRELLDRLDLPWDQAANWLFEARAAISAGLQEHSVHAVENVEYWLARVDDPWLRVRGQAVQAELARIQGRFGDAVVHLRDAAETSQRLGFQQTAAYQTMLLGRAECQAGDTVAGAATLGRAVDRARAVGDVRLVALAQTHLGRAARVVGDHATARATLEAAVGWHRGAGGGEQALVGESLLAGLDAAEGVPGTEQRLIGWVEAADRAADATAEVLSLDALARIALDRDDRTGADRLLERADRRMAAAAHQITDSERPDAEWVRARIRLVPRADASTRMPPTRP